MPNATVRAADKGLPKSAPKRSNANAMPTQSASTPKRDPLPTAADLRQTAADLRSAVALLEAAKIVERQLAEPNKERAAADDPTQPTTASLRRQTADPVFALIDRHRAATAVWLEALRWADNDLATEADEAADTAACQVETEAMAALLETIPQTVEGVAAVLRYVATVDGGCAPDDVQKFAAYVARSPVFEGRAA